MEFLSNFVERLDELIFDRGLNGKQFANEIGVVKTTVYNYLNKKRQPDIAVLVRIADYFQVTTDFLLGREPESRATRFRPCPPFSERIKALLAQKKISKVEFCKAVPITHSVLYYWLSGKTLPSLEYLIRLADYFKCTIDYILGREF